MLIPDARRWHRFWSVRINVFCAIFAESWPLLPFDWQQDLQAHFPHVIAILSIGSIVARVIKQAS
jgi:hypothetical protein